MQLLLHSYSYRRKAQQCEHVPLYMCSPKNYYQLPLSLRPNVTDSAYTLRCANQQSSCTIPIHPNAVRFRGFCGNEGEN